MSDSLGFRGSLRVGGSRLRAPKQRDPGGGVRGQEEEVVSEAMQTTDDAAIGTFAPFGEFDPSRFAAPGLSVGLDAGATLTKLCVRPATAPRLRRLAIERPRRGNVAARPGPARRDRLRRGRLLSKLAAKQRARSVRGLGARSGRDAARIGQARAPYLLVAVGTGLGARVDGDAVERMGGTALGGGAALDSATPGSARRKS